MHKHRCVSWCVIMVQNPQLVFPQFNAFLTHCYAQSEHNFKIVFLVARIHDAPHNNAPLQSKKTVNRTFTFDRTRRAFFSLGFSGRFRWIDWAALPQPYTHDLVVVFAQKLMRKHQLLMRAF